MQRPENNVFSPNPYGSVSSDEIDNFERKVSLKIPEDYRSYLSNFNGGMFEKNDSFSLNRPENSFRIGELFSLNVGPETSRLNENWGLFTYYDLEHHETNLRKYIAIGFVDGGNILLINSEDGAICVYEHEDKELTEGPRGPIVPISPSFSEFVSNLVTSQQAKQLLAGTDEFPEIMRRVEQLKRERQIRVRLRSTDRNSS